MKKASITQTSLVKNKWDEKKTCANIYINPKLCFLNYRGGRNTSKIPLAITHLSFFLATFQVQSPQGLQCNLLTSWVRTMWLFSIKRIQNLILQHLSWKKHIKKYIPHEILKPAYTNIWTAAGGTNSSSSKKKKKKKWTVKDNTLRLSRPTLLCFSLRCWLIFAPDACKLHH